MKKYLAIALLALALFSTACKNKVCNDKNCMNPDKKTMAANGQPDTASLTCKLSTQAQLERSETLRATLFSKYEKVNETSDAMEFVYADSKKYAPTILEFISTERECCPFVTFNMHWEPNSDKVSLSIGGSPRIKEMLKTLIK
jgi:hypothetical protein